MAAHSRSQQNQHSRSSKTYRRPDPGYSVGVTNFTLMRSSGGGVEEICSDAADLQKILHSRKITPSRIIIEKMIRRVEEILHNIPFAQPSCILEILERG